MWALWALLLVVRGAAEDPQKRHFMLIGQQRTGTTWVVAELDKNPCILARDELMLERPGFTWTESRRRNAFQYLYDKPEDRRPPRTTEKWHRFYYEIDRAMANLTHPDAVLSVGFKWMMDIKQHLTWLQPMWKRHNVRIIILRRRNLLKTLISRVVNTATTKAHPTPEEAKAMSQKKVKLPVGRRLITDLRYLESKYLELKTLFIQFQRINLDAKIVVYEDLMAEPQRFRDLVRFTIGGDAIAERCMDYEEDAATSFKSVGKIHTKSLRDELANYDSVYETLRHSKFYIFLKEDDELHQQNISSFASAKRQKKPRRTAGNRASPMT